MNTTTPITPPTQTPSGPSRTAARPSTQSVTARSTARTTVTRPSSWAASARTMPKGVPPAAFSVALAQATMPRLALQSSAGQGAASQSVTSQPSPLQALALQAMLGTTTADGSPAGLVNPGQPSLFATGQGVPSQAELLQLMAARITPVQAAAATAAPAPAATAPATPPPASGVLSLPNGLGPIVQQAADKYGVDPALIAGVIEIESSFNASAVSRAGARGLMQLMPATARNLGVNDASDPLQNVLGGAKLLGQMLDKYGGNVELALAAYNAGAGNVDKYGGIPPFGETRRYVPTVLAAAERYRQSAASQPAPTSQTDAAARPAAPTTSQTTGQNPGRAPGR